MKMNERKVVQLIIEKGDLKKENRKKREKIIYDTC
jgi:hypothetical protein